MLVKEGEKALEEEVSEEESCWKEMRGESTVRGRLSGNVREAGGTRLW